MPLWDLFHPGICAMYLLGHIDSPDTLLCGLPAAHVHGVLFWVCPLCCPAALICKTYPQTDSCVLLVLAANECTCPNGTPTVHNGSGPTLCDSHGAEDCSACTSGYHLSAAATAAGSSRTCTGEWARCTPMPEVVVGSAAGIRALYLMKHIDSPGTALCGLPAAHVYGVLFWVCTLCCPTA